MKINSLSLIVLAASLILGQSSAFAKHAYGSEDCLSKTLHLRYKGNYPIGGYYGISKKGTDLNKDDAKEFMTIPFLTAEVYSKEDYAEAEVVYEEVKVIKTSNEKTEVDCDFEYQTWDSRKLLKIKKVSAKAAKALGLKKDQTIKFACSEGLILPINGKCDNQ